MTDKQKKRTRARPGAQVFDFAKEREERARKDALSGVLGVAGRAQVMVVERELDLIPIEGFGLGSTAEGNIFVVMKVPDDVDMPEELSIDAVAYAMPPELARRVGNAFLVMADNLEAGAKK